MNIDYCQAHSAESTFYCYALCFLRYALSSIDYSSKKNSLSDSYILNLNEHNKKRSEPFNENKLMFHLKVPDLRGVEVIGTILAAFKTSKLIL